MSTKPLVSFVFQTKIVSFFPSDQNISITIKYWFQFQFDYNQFFCKKEKLYDFNHVILSILKKKTNNKINKTLY
jgi:hypothetical protein